MSRLMKGMYGNQFLPRPKDSNLFGLKDGQMRRSIPNFDHKVGHNVGWYNSKGEKLGWGDLSQSDLENIKEGLLENEAFLIIPEEDSYWNIKDLELDIKAPGIDYVLNKIAMAVFPGKIFKSAEPEEIKKLLNLSDSTSNLCDCMKDHTEPAHTCKDHPDPWDCSDAVFIKTKTGIGIPIRDGGRSFIEVSFCPICGEKVKQS